ncbi:MAG: hypothetical protein GY757_46655, partial [bacterium]|nr:hypothetical protein [bacterium]
MPADIKFKVLLIQLPFLREEMSNIPLAAGYLKAMAHQDSMLEDIDIEILKNKTTNTGDAILIKEILAGKPDMVGFSLYLWNTERSLFIAEEIKKKSPRIKIVIGGPEVNEDSYHLFENSAVDIGCIGEGEAVFVDILKHAFYNQTDINSIKGIFYRKAN